MNATIQKWGNSLALRIPQAVARQIHVAEGDQVMLKVADDALEIRCARPRYRLKDLLQRINQKNRHVETDWGTAEGTEGW